MEKIAAGVVLFNPNFRTEECLKKLNEQVERVYIYDNSTDKIDIVLPNEIVYLTEGENKGIAYALNRIMEKAKSDGYSWVLTMDQDSILPEGMIASCTEHLNNTKIGIVCPQVIDTRRLYMQVKTKPNIEYMEECITSGSCTSVKVWEAVGGFDEWLFIDFVDNDFCKRLRMQEYQILRLNHLIMNQEFGSIMPKTAWKQKFWITLSRILHIENIAKFSYKKNVNPMRVYYVHRNLLYLNQKYAECGGIGYQNFGCKSYLGFIISFTIPSFLRATKKKEVMKAIADGLHDGKNCDKESIGKRD